MDRTAVVVPLKDFAAAKSRLRLAGVSRVDERLREMAAGVLAAARPRPVYVACESGEVADFALAHGARVLRSDARDLNGAARHALQALGEEYDFVMFVHGDIREPQGLGEFIPTATVTIVSDHHGTGTNVLVVPTQVDFRFHYGQGSAQAHRDEAQRLGLDVDVIVNSPWRFDVDEASDIGSQ